MASGQQKAQQNLEAFEVWKATQTDDGFKQIVFRGQLNRIEVAKGIGCGKSALNQNPALKKALKASENCTIVSSTMRLTSQNTRT